MTKFTINVPNGYLATATVDGKPYTADPKAMTNDALLHVFEYGFQRIVNDKCGGKDKGADEKASIASGTIERLTAETYVRRATRESSGDPLASFVRGFLRAKLQAVKGEAYAAYKAADADGRNELLDAMFAKQDEATQAAIRAEAEAERERHEAELARKRQLADKLGAKLSLAI